MLSDRKESAIFSDNVQAAYEYYPFGMAMQTFTSSYYRYGFNGQEKDDEVYGKGNSYSYMYRFHDVRLGRFFAVDPLINLFPWNSPYAFSENRVLDAFELEGLETVLMNPADHNYDNNVAAAQSQSDKSAIHIYAHSNSTGFEDKVTTSYSWADTKGEFIAALKNDDQYEVQSKTGKYIVVMHACNLGKPLIGKNGQYIAPLAQTLSNDIDGTIIAPDGYDSFNNFGELGPIYRAGDVKPGESSRGNIVKAEEQESANWLVYTDGVLTSVYSSNFDPVGESNFITDLLVEKKLTFKVNVSEGSHLNLRAGAGANTKDIGDLKSGSILSPTGNVKDGWMEITSDDGQKGWVKSILTTPVY